jgi:adenine-specific DNA-methyltransferase
MRRREAANGSIKPFQLQWARNEKIFETEKIVVPYRTRENAFAFNNSEWFCRSDAYVITPKNEHVDLFYLLGVLNSKLNYIWLYYKGKRKGEVLELFQVPLSEIPIIELNKEEHEKISSIAKEITDMKKRDKNCKTEDLEDEIDNILFSAYGLSPMEINSVLSKGEEVNEK